MSSTDSNVIPDASPLELIRVQVKPDWLDYNGHMNVTYYTMTFDQAFDKFQDRMGIGREYVEQEAQSFFALHYNIHYHSEVTRGQTLTVTLQLLEVGEKKIRVMMIMYADGSSNVVATGELLSIHVDMKSRRASAIPKEQREQLDLLLKSHKNLPTAHWQDTP